MSAPRFAPRRATRHNVPIKVAVTGPAGSGKTRGALAIACRLAEHKRPGSVPLVLDSENRTAEYYADRYAFDVIDFAPPYLTRTVLDVLRYAEAEDYGVVVLDSLTHVWDGDGGILDRKQAHEKRAGGKVNGFTLWAEYKAEWRDMMARLVASPLDIVVTMRSRTEYVQGERDGKKVVDKLGLAPVIGEQADYEFSVVFDLNTTHAAQCSKDRTGLFPNPDAWYDLIADDVPGQLVRWRASGAPMRPREARSPGAAAGAAAGADAGDTAAAIWTAAESTWDGDVNAAGALVVKGAPIDALSDATLAQLVDAVDGRALPPAKRRLADAMVAIIRARAAGRATGATVAADAPADAPADAASPSRAEDVAAAATLDAARDADEEAFLTELGFPPEHATRPEPPGLLDDVALADGRARVRRSLRRTAGQHAPVHAEDAR